MSQNSFRTAALLCILVCFSLAIAASRVAAEDVKPPRISDPTVKLSLFAADPDVVTPIGATVDAHGRLLIVESHSHFRPKDYKGPPTDRIRILADTDGDGKADKFTTWYEGESFLMNVAADRADNSIVVSSRNEVFRLYDAGDHATNRTTIAKLETTATYPHNGLHGLAIDKDRNVYFGIGENLGGPWTLVGTDGSKVSDDTGSGAVFRCDANGAHVVRLAHGFWNPFGLGVDPNGTLWAVDNDPDGRPPCRLINVAPGADYGYQFRYGRTGMHPLQAWDAELPGTLGMVAGVGEAPCAVVWHNGRLLVSSWRDHVLQSFTLTPRGATYTAALQPILEGDENFRPVGIAPSPDGSVYVTDWVSSSYPVHGKGRLWKLTFPAGAGDGPKVTEEMKRAAHFRQSDALPELLAALDSTDPAMAQAAQYGLSRMPQCDQITWTSLKTPRQRIGLLAALLIRGTNTRPFVTQAFGDEDDYVRQMAVRCIAEQNLTDARGDLETLLQSRALSPRLLAMTVATIGQLSGDKSAKVDPNKINAILQSRLADPKATDDARAACLRMMMASHPKLPIDQLKALAHSPMKALQLEAVRYLNDDPDKAKYPVLQELALDVKADEMVRAEAVDGLAGDAEANIEVLLKLTGAADESVAREAIRSLRTVAAKLTPQQRQTVTAMGSRSREMADQVHRLFGEPLGDRPAEQHVAAWDKMLGQSAGDASAGRRLFYHSAGPGCFNCHMVEGRGKSIGPDLTMIGHSQTREHVLESILDPSREIAPLYTLWTITQKSGEKTDGMLLRRDGQAMEVYVDSAGKEIKIPEKQIVDRKIRKESLMPTGLVQGMTDQELRDLLAFLTERR